MATRVRVFSSSVGTKLVIGITGFALFIYLLIHIAGNALILFGPEVFNGYAYTMEVQNKLVHVKAFRFSPEHDLPGGGRDLYRQEFENLSDPLIVGFYVLSMFVVGSHLWHGISSSVQSLGFDHPKWTPRVLLAGKLFAAAIALGFMIIAVWVYLNQPVRV